MAYISHQELTSNSDSPESVIALQGVLQRDGRIVEVSEVFEPVGEARAQDVLGSRLWEAPWWRDAGDETQTVREACIRAAGGSGARCTVSGRLPDKTPLIVSLEVAPLDEGTAVVNALRFVLRGRVDYRRLAADRQCFVSLAENSPYFIGMWNAQFKMTFLNAAGRRTAGLDGQRDLHALEVKDFFFPEDHAFLFAEFFPKVEDTGEGEVELRLRHLETGAATWVSYSVFILRASDGTFHGFGTVTRNISQHKLAERSLRESEAALRVSEERYRAIVEGQAEMVCRFRPDGTILFVNGAYARARGTTPEALTGADFWSFVDEADRPGVRNMLGKLRPDNSEIRIENRFETADGTRWTLWTNRGLAFDAAGHATEVQSAGIDITARKQAEAALQEAEARLRQQHAELEQTYHYAPVGLCVLDRELRFVRINERLAIINGLSVEEHIGRHITEIVPTLADSAKAVIDQILATGEAVREHELAGETIAEPGIIRHWIESWYPVRNVDDDIIGFGVVVEDVTSRKRYEEELRASQERKQLAVTAAGLGLFEWDAGRNTVAWENERMYEIFGHAPADGILDAPDFFSDYLYPPDLETVDTAVRTAMQPGATLSYTCRIYRKSDGALRWIQVSGKFAFGADNMPQRLVGVIEDITERRAAEAALRESEERFRTMADTAPAMLWVTNENHECTFLSRGWYEFTGQTSATGLKMGWTEAVHPEDRAQTKKLFLNACQRREPFAFDYRLQGSDGSFRWAIDAGRPRFSASGAFLGYIGSVIDVHERKEAEKALQQAHDQLEARVHERTRELQRRAKQLSRLSSELTLTEQRERQRIAQVLHDHLQQLLVAASLRLGLVARNLPKAQKAPMQEIGELLEEAIRSSRSLTVELAPPILHEAGLSAGLRWLARWMDEKHGLDVTLYTDDNATSEAEDVRILLFHSVRELLFNVVKHAGVKKATVDLTIHDDDYLEVTVSDEGPGFDASVVLDRDAKDHSGFGLFSIQERLSLLGGRLEIDRVAGHGACIVMLAPMRRAGAIAPIHAQESAIITTAQGERAVERVKRLQPGLIRVLLVDDHNVMRQGVSALLSDEPDIEVIGEASNGEEGIAQAHALQPDLILMDFSMPKMNGVEATRRIRDELPHIKVIGLSMYEEPDQAAAMLGAGAAAYRMKSGNSEELLNTIRTVYRMRPASQE